MADSHPLTEAFRLVHPMNHDSIADARPAHLRWWEFAPPSAADTMADTVGDGPSADADDPRGLVPQGGTWLYDLCTGTRAHTLAEALPDLPFAATEIFPSVEQEPAAAAWTQATVDELKADGSARGEGAAAVCERLRCASLESRLAHLGTRPLSLHSLQAMATFLGLSLRSHPHLLWIASAALCARLPASWREATAADGLPFYFDAELGLTTHEHPAHAYWRGVVRFVLESEASEASVEAGLAILGSALEEAPANEEDGRPTAAEASTEEEAASAEPEAAPASAVTIEASGEAPAPALTPAPDGHNAAATEDEPAVEAAAAPDDTAARE